MTSEAAHSLTAPAAPAEDATVSEKRSLRGLLEAILEPFGGSSPVNLAIAEVMIGRAAVTPLALVFYGICTNSVEYGTLSQVAGRLAITSERRGDRLVIHWDETLPGQAGPAI